MEPDRPTTTTTDRTRYASRRRRVLAGALATAVLATGGTAVALADDGATASSSGQGTAPAVQTIQDDDQSTQPQAPQGGDRDDCPEGSGSGSGSGAESGSAQQSAPQTDAAPSEV